MIFKNILHHLKLQWQLLQFVRRHDVLVEKSVTVKYGDDIVIGNHCTLQSGVYLYGSRFGKAVVFGDYVAISAGCILLGGGGLKIGSFTHLGPRVVVTTQYGDSRSNMRQPNAQLKYAAVKLGQGCWVGSGAVLMPGVVLGDGCIVAPQSVVFGQWPSNTKLSGNPARPSKSFET